jgi:hypothetical protein
VAASSWAWGIPSSPSCCTNQRGDPRRPWSHTVDFASTKGLLVLVWSLAARGQVFLGTEPWVKEKAHIYIQVQGEKEKEEIRWWCVLLFRSLADSVWLGWMSKSTLMLLGYAERASKQLSFRIKWVSWAIMHLAQGMDHSLLNRLAVFMGWSVDALDELQTYLFVFSVHSHGDIYFRRIGHGRLWVWVQQFSDGRLGYFERIYICNRV